MNASAQPAPGRCPRCGRSLDAELGGLCPVCALGDAAVTANEAGRPAAGVAQLLLDDLPPEDLPHARLGKYELHEPIGAGGMGMVYRAWQADLERWVAVKLLPVGQFERPEARERFRQEALTLARLRHPNIVAIHDFGENAGQPYLVMELVDGASLALRTRDWLASPERAASHLKAAAEAVQAAHDQGVLHRDLKPSNILVGTDGQVRITDFGLACAIEGRSGLTDTGDLLGTLAYLAPEQLADGSRAANVRSDVYALGAVFYEVLTGRPPFVAASPASLAQQILHSEPPSPRLLNPLVSNDLATICLKCLRPDPQHRYASARELAEDLARFLTHVAIRARPSSRAARLWRWARLNPGWGTAAALGLALVLILGAAGVVQIREGIATIRHQLAEGREAARRDAIRAYAQQLASVLRALETANPSRAGELLEATPSAQRGWEFAVLERLLAGRHRSWPAHDQGIAAVVPDPEGHVVVSGDRAGNVRFWEIASEQRLRHEHLHEHAVTSVQRTPDGHRLVTSSADGTACVFDLPTTNVIARFEAGAILHQARLLRDADGVLTVGEHGRLERWSIRQPASAEVLLTLESPLQALDVLPSTGAYACGDASGRIHLGRLDSLGEERHSNTSAIANRSWPAHQQPVRSVAWSPDGTALASASEDGAVRLWDPSTGEPRRTLRESGRPIRCLAWSPDGGTLAAAGDDGEILIWSAEDNTPPQVLRGHQGPVFTLTFLGREGRIVSGGRDRRLHIWDVRSGATNQVFRLERPSSVLRVQFDPAGGSLVGGGAKGELWRHELEQGGTNWSTRSRQGRVTALAVSPDGRWVVSGGTASRIEVRAMANGELLRELPAGDRAIRCLAFHPDGRLLAVGGDDRILQLLDFDSGQVVRAFPPHAARIGRIAFSADGSYVVYSGGDQRLAVRRVRDTADAAPAMLPVLVQDFNLSTDGRLLTLDRTGGVRIWRVPDLAPAAVADGLEPGLRAGTFTPDGTRVVTTEDGGGLRVWDASTGIQLLHLPLPSARVRDVQFSPDGHLAMVGLDGELFLWP